MQCQILYSIWLLYNLYYYYYYSGVEPAQVQERVENHLKSLLIKHFDPQKADSIFTVEGEVRDFSLNHEHLVKKKGKPFLMLNCQRARRWVFEYITNPVCCGFRLQLGWNRWLPTQHGETCSISWQKLTLTVWCSTSLWRYNSLDTKLV